MQGGQLATILEANSGRGDLFCKEYASRLLRHVCVPLHTMINHWIYRGEINDPQGDFFIIPRQSPTLSQPAGNAWHGSYQLRSELLPSFIPRPLANMILRAGKTINFLRENCGDMAWVQESACVAHMSTLAADQVR